MFLFYLLRKRQPSQGSTTLLLKASNNMPQSQQMPVLVQRLTAPGPIDIC